jgi:hypothetical protein
LTNGLNIDITKAEAALPRFAFAGLGCKNDLVCSVGSGILSDSLGDFEVALRGCRWHIPGPIHDHHKAVHIPTQHEAEAIAKS